MRKVPEWPVSPRLRREPNEPFCFALVCRWFAPGFLAVKGKDSAAMRAVVDELVHGEIFQLELLSPKFCTMLLEELHSFERSGLAKELELAVRSVTGH